MISKDIFIASESNTNENSRSNIGWSYVHQSYQYNSDIAKTILAGSHKFQTVEIEVFSKIN